jgi:hypothetical protein
MNKNDMVASRYYRYIYSVMIYSFPIFAWFSILHVASISISKQEERSIVSMPVHLSRTWFSTGIEPKYVQDIDVLISFFVN